MDRPKPSEEEFARGRWDPVRWAWVYLGIRLHAGQEQMVNAYIQRNHTGYRALWLWLLVSAGNRAGKTLALDVIILHSCVYRIGLKPPKDMENSVEVERWGKLPYDWWHFAVEQGPAEQVHRDLVRILLGTHESQEAGCPWSDQVGGADKIATMSDPGTGSDAMTWGSKERGEYAWIILAPELGGAQIHFRSMKQKALGAVGQNAHGVSVDEAGLDPELSSHIKEVFHARRIGTGGQFVAISTPSRDTSPDFEELWYTGDPDNPFRLPHRFAMQMSTRDNIGFGIDKADFDDLIEGMDEDWIAQNIDGVFMAAIGVWFSGTSVDAAFDETLPELQGPQEGMVYIHALDPGLGDKCWTLVFRVKPNMTIEGVFIDRMARKQTTRGIVRLGKTSHHTYEMGGLAFVDTGVDTTALGGHIFRELLEEDDARGIVDEYGEPMVPLKGIPVKSVEFGGVTQVKRRMLSDLRSALDEGRIKMPATGFWSEVRKQLRKYKLADRKLEQDLVMCLAIVVKLLRQSPVQVRQTPTKLDMTQGWVPDEEERVNDGINSRSLRSKQRQRRILARALTAAREGE